MPITGHNQVFNTMFILSEFLSVSSTLLQTIYNVAKRFQNSVKAHGKGKQALFGEVYDSSSVIKKGGMVDRRLHDCTPLYSVHKKPVCCRN